MSTATVSEVRIYPVKSLAGTAPEAAVVEPWGLTGDRRWMVVDPQGRALTQREQPRLALAWAEPQPDGGVRIGAAGREPLNLEPPEPGRGGRPVTLFGKTVVTVPAGGAADAWLSAHLDTEVHLVHLDDPAVRRPIDPTYSLPGETVSLADGFPLLVTTTASLEALNSLIARGDHAHEGPLPMGRFRPNVVVDGTAPWAEDDWRLIRIGEVTFRVVKPCGRCVVTTTDQFSAERGREPLRTLGRHRKIGGSLVFGQNLIPEQRGTVRVGDPVRVLA